MCSSATAVYVPAMTNPILTHFEGNIGGAIEMKT